MEQDDEQSATFPVWHRFLSGFVGTVGDHVEATWNGIHYVRSKPKNVKNPNTPKQVAAKDLKMTGFNLFIKTICRLLMH